MTGRWNSLCAGMLSSISRLRSTTRWAMCLLSQTKGPEPEVCFIETRLGRGHCTRRSASPASSLNCRAQPSELPRPKRPIARRSDSLESGERRTWPALARNGAIGPNSACADFRRAKARAALRMPRPVRCQHLVEIAKTTAVTYRDPNRLFAASVAGGFVPTSVPWDRGTEPYDCPRASFSARHHFHVS